MFEKYKMAVQIRNRILSSNLFNYCKCWTSFVRSKSDAHVVMTDDSSVIVFWHPETHFPYDKSLPLPEKKVLKSHSILKVQSNKEFLSLFKPKREEVVREELMRLTSTTKHIWFPKKKQFRRKPAPEPDRPYL